MASWGLAARIQAVLVACTLLVLLLTVLQVASVRKVDRQASEVVATTLAHQLKLREIQAEAGQWVKALYGMPGTDAADRMTDGLAVFQQRKLQVMNEMRELQDSVVEVSLTARLQQFRDTLMRLFEEYEAAMQAKVNSDNRTLAGLLETIADTERTALEQVDDTVSGFALQLQEVQDRQQQKSRQQNGILILSMAALLVCVSAVFFAYLRWQLIAPLRDLTSAADRLSDDETDIVIEHAERGDELGALARSLRVFRRNRISELALVRATQESAEERERQIREDFELRRDAGENERRESERQQALQRANDSAASEQLLQLRIDRLSMGVTAAAEGDLTYLAQHPCENLHLGDALARMTMELESLFSQFAQDFGKIRQEALNVSHSAVQLEGFGQSIDESADLNHTQSRQVLTGAQAVRDALLEVSDSVDRMEVGIRGISDHASQASTVASQAVELAGRTNCTMRTLSESSQDIGNVIKLINSVAEQTNLLALNATIEAARAGEAGKGFAVVANEVKELAKETNKATDEIQTRITAIRNDTDQAVEAIGSINHIVSEIDGLQASISESVRVQSDTATRITTLVGEATGNNKNVRGILAEVVERQQDTRQAAASVRQSSGEVRSSAEGNVRLTSRYHS